MCFSGRRQLRDALVSRMGPLPFHAAFFSGIDVSHLLNFAEEKSLDVIEEEVLRVRAC